MSNRSRTFRAPHADPSIVMWAGAIACAAGWIEPAYVLLAQLLALAVLLDARPGETT